MKESVKRSAKDYWMRRLLIVLNVSRSAYQELDFTATRENGINFGTIFNTRYLNCIYIIIFILFLLFFFGTFTIAKLAVGDHGDNKY